MAMKATDKQKKSRRTLSSTNRRSVFKARFEPALVHCDGCGKDVFHIDGCPNCGTTKFLKHCSNQ